MKADAARPGVMIAAVRVSAEGRNTVHRRVELVLAEQGRTLADCSADEYVELATRAETDVYPELNR